MTAGTLNARHADQGLPAADRAHQHRGPVDQRRPRAQPEGAGGGRARPTPSAPPAPSAARCTASPCSSRTTSTSPGMPDHGGLGRARELDPGPRTRRWWPSCAPRARSCSASSTCPSSRTSSPTAMPSGYSSLGGQVLNPYNADITPSGSSSGSGAAAAAGLAAITIGTETSRLDHQPGRRRRASSACGRRSASCRAPASCRSRATQDTAGPMTRTVADAAAELGAIAGKDPEDPATDTAPDTVPDYLAGLSPTALRGQADRRHQQHQRAVRRRRSRRSRRSARRRCRSPTPTAAGAPSTSSRRSSSATSTRTSARLPASAPMKTLADIIAYNTAHADDALKYGQTQLAAQPGDGPDRPGAERRLRHDPRQRPRATRSTAIDNALTRGTADPADDLEAIMTRGHADRRSARSAGYPQLGVPAGYSADDPRPGRDRVQRHGLQRGEAARVRLRLRAGDEAAQAAERDQPEPVALRPGQRVHGHDARVRAERRPPTRMSIATTGQRHGAGDALAHARRARRRSRRSTPGVARDYTASHDRERDLHRGRRDARRRPSERPAASINGSFSLAQPLQACETRYAATLDASRVVQRAGRRSRSGRRSAPTDAAADGHVREDADVHAVDHQRRKPPLTHLHARRFAGVEIGSSFRPFRTGRGTMRGRSLSSRRSPRCWSGRRAAYAPSRSRA